MPYKKHLFICTKCKRNENGDTEGEALFNEVKSSINKSELKQKGIRLSSSGCMGLCQNGINAIVYPEGKVIDHLKNDPTAKNLLIQELN